MSKRNVLRIGIWSMRLGLALAITGSITLGGVSAHAAETTNRLAANRLAANRVAANRLAANRLAANRLAANSLAGERLATTRLEASPETAEILNTPDGREVYSYIVNCALRKGTVIEADIADAADTAPPDTIYKCKGGHCVFSGSLGLAEEWMDNRLSRKGQRWITACLLARVNHYGVTETISMRGVAPELSVSPQESELYSLQEGAFYGNIFADGEGELDWNACRGKDKAATPDEGVLAMRACAQPDPNDPTHTMCGFKYTGDCGSFGSLPERHACWTFDSEDGSFGDCTTAEGKTDARSLRLYREVISTYVRH
jgi:hypothetical protein